MRAQQQLGEVDQAGAVAARLVLDVGLAHGFQPGVVRFGLDVLRAAAFVLLRVDPPRDLLGRILAVVQFQRLHHAFDQPQLVVRIHHLEAFGQLRVLPVQAQQAVGQAVEGADPHAAAAVGQLRVDAVAHFAGRLVGEGHRENAVGRHAIDFMQPGDAVGEYAGLAGTGTGQHPVVAGGSGDGFALGRVQAIKQVGDIHAPILRHRRRGSCDHLGGQCVRLLTQFRHGQAFPQAADAQAAEHAQSCLRLAAGGTQASTRHCAVQAQPVRARAGQPIGLQLLQQGIAQRAGTGFHAGGVDHPADRPLLRLR
ncbi:hypothetical protein G6F68_011200 [Rhizopus microsporus]|nr:hypothetical protein G6F68_011200 [Rhizopus microsporus]